MEPKQEDFLEKNEKPKPYFAQCNPGGMPSKHFYHIVDARKWLAVNGGGTIKLRQQAGWDHIEDVYADGDIIEHVADDAE